MDLQTISALAEKRIHNGDVTLKDLREGHLKAFVKDGFHLNQEAYKYTNISRFFEELKYEPRNNPFALDEYIDERVPTLYFIDGDLQFLDLKVPGVKTSFLKDPEDKNGDALTHLHRSLMTDSVCIEVGKNVVLNSPIRLLHILTRGGIVAPAVRVKANPYSKFTLIEENIAVDSSYALLSETSLEICAGAQVEHIQIDQGKEESLQHGKTVVNVEKDACYRNVIIHESGKLNRRNLEINLNASGAHGESYSLYLTNGKEHSDISTVINHHAPDSTSNQIAKGILDQESKGIFTGRIHIFPQAQRVISGQLNKNLLLSKKAQAHSQPQLEIYADDVKCSHGSTTGQLSPEEVFYFEARGIPKERARTLLAHAFGMEIVMKIEDKVARETVTRLVLETLKNKFSIGGTHEHH